MSSGINPDQLQAFNKVGCAGEVFSWDKPRRHGKLWHLGLTRMCCSRLRGKKNLRWSRRCNTHICCKVQSSCNTSSVCDHSYNITMSDATLSASHESFTDSVNLCWSSVLTHINEIQDSNTLLRIIEELLTNSLITIEGASAQDISVDADREDTPKVSVYLDFLCVQGQEGDFFDVLCHFNEMTCSWEHKNSLRVRFPEHHSLDCDPEGRCVFFGKYMNMQLFLVWRPVDDENPGAAISVDDVTCFKNFICSLCCNGPLELRRMGILQLPDSDHFNLDGLDEVRFSRERLELLSISLQTSYDTWTQSHSPGSFFMQHKHPFLVAMEYGQDVRIPYSHTLQSFSGKFGSVTSFFDTSKVVKMDVAIAVDMHFDGEPRTTVFAFPSPSVINRSFHENAHLYSKGFCENTASCQWTEESIMLNGLAHALNKTLETSNSLTMLRTKLRYANHDNIEAAHIDDSNLFNDEIDEDGVEGISVQPEPPVVVRVLKGQAYSQMKKFTRWRPWTQAFSRGHLVRDFFMHKDTKHKIGPANWKSEVGKCEMQLNNLHKTGAGYRVEHIVSLDLRRLPSFAVFSANTRIECIEELLNAICMQVIFYLSGGTQGLRLTPLIEGALIRDEDWLKLSANVFPSILDRYVVLFAALLERLDELRSHNSVLSIQELEFVACIERLSRYMTTGDKRVLVKPMHSTYIPIDKRGFPLLSSALWNVKDCRARVTSEWHYQRNFQDRISCAAKSIKFHFGTKAAASYQRCLNHCDIFEDTDWARNLDRMITKISFVLRETVLSDLWHEFVEKHPEAGDVVNRPFSVDVQHNVGYQCVQRKVSVPDITKSLLSFADAYSGTEFVWPRFLKQLQIFCEMFVRRQHIQDVSSLFENALSKCGVCFFPVFQGTTIKWNQVAVVEEWNAFQLGPESSIWNLLWKVTPYNVGEQLQQFRSSLSEMRRPGVHVSDSVRQILLSLYPWDSPTGQLFYLTAHVFSFVQHISAGKRREKKKTRELYMCAFMLGLIDFSLGLDVHAVPEALQATYLQVCKKTRENSSIIMLTYVVSGLAKQHKDTRNVVFLNEPNINSITACFVNGCKLRLAALTRSLETFNIAAYLFSFGIEQDEIQSLGYNDANLNALKEKLAFDPNMLVADFSNVISGAKRSYFEMFVDSCQTADDGAAALDGHGL